MIEIYKSEINNDIFDESDNTFSIVAPSAVYIEKSIPTEFELFDNYPDPFNATTTINFAIPKTGQATLKVLDIAGREVITLLNEELSVGQHSVIFQADGLAVGVFL